MKKLFSMITAALLLFVASSTFAQRLSTLGEEEVVRNRVIKQSPIVFLGRPLQSEFYEDKTGDVYITTVIQVLEVLRGEGKIESGTVEYVEAFKEQTPELKSLANRHASPVYDGEYGVYFSEESTFPSMEMPFITSNNTIQLKPFGNLQESKLYVSYAKDGYIIGGLYKGWETPSAMIGYINSLPNLRAIKKPVTPLNYPEIEYIDKRPGINKLIFQQEVVDTSFYWPVNKFYDKGKPIINLNKDEIRYLPKLMEKIRCGSELSKRDIILIKNKIPNLNVEDIQNNNKLKYKKKPASYNKKGNSSRLFPDTTLTMSIRNLKTTDTGACSNSLQGELWLKSNVPGLYLNQLYFEISTTADFELQDSPFGATLAGTYTALSGAPDYSFYQFYDTTERKITIVGYPSFVAPQRVDLSSQSLQPLFRFEYPVATIRPSQRPKKLEFEVVPSEMSREYTNYFFTANPVGYDAYFPKQFDSQIAESAAVIKRPRALIIDSIRAFENLGQSVQARMASTGIDTLTINKTEITAGTGTILKIYGEGFKRRVNPADTTQRGKLQFVNADVAPTIFLDDIDNMDIISWRDTLIQVRIPAQVSGGNIRPSTVGGGPIRVINHCNAEFQSADTLDIKYNLDATKPRLNKRRVYLASVNCSPGLSFHLDKRLAAVPGAKSTIKAALRHWSQQLSIPLLLAPDLVDGVNKIDNRNVILLSNSVSGMLAKLSYIPFSSKEGLSNIESARYSVNDVDILVSENLAWSYDTTSAAVTHDAYASFLHEIGHALGLNHVVDEKDVMFYMLSDSRRKTLLNNRPATIRGAQRSIADAKKIKWTNNIDNGFVIGTIGSPLANCNTQNRVANEFYPVQQVGLGTEVYLYPNPSRSESVLVVPRNNGTALHYSILDSRGTLIEERSVGKNEVIMIGKGLPDGLYLVKVRTDAKYLTLRMVKSQ